MNFFAIYLSDKVSFNTTVRQILSRRRISLTWGEDRLNVVRDGLCALTFARVPLGLKILHVQTFQNYQSTITIWLSLRKIFQLTKTLKSRDLVWPLFSLLKCSYLTQLSKLYLLQWKSCIRCWKFPSHSSKQNLKNSLLFSLVIISSKIHFMNTNQAVISHVNER